MEPFTALTATAVPLETINLDTDQILPARFLKYPRKDSYGKFLLRDQRQSPDFVLNQPAYAGAGILIGNLNFGCGSAREGAIYALFDYGFRCIVAPSFGDIFFNNACKNGLLPVRLPADDVAALRNLATRRPDATFTIDLPAQTVQAEGGAALPFAIDSFRKSCLVKGLDDISLTLHHRAEIDAFAQRFFAEHPWRQPAGTTPRRT